MKEKFFVYDRIEELYWAKGKKEFTDKRENAAIYNLKTVKKILKTSKKECIFEPVYIKNL